MTTASSKRVAKDDEVRCGNPKPKVRARSVKRPDTSTSIIVHGTQYYCERACVGSISNRPSLDRDREYDKMDYLPIPDMWRLRGKSPRHSIADSLGEDVQLAVRFWDEELDIDYYRDRLNNLNPEYVPVVLAYYSRGKATFAVGFLYPLADKKTMHKGRGLPSTYSGWCLNVWSSKSANSLSLGAWMRERCKVLDANRNNRIWIVQLIGDTGGTFKSEPERALPMKVSTFCILLQNFKNNTHKHVIIDNVMLCK